MIDFIIDRITMEGFRSFREPQTFIVNRPPGLYFICGDNHTDKLGANGVGKSTIWDALVWCLYGKTILGLRGQVIKNWKSTTCKVSVIVFKDGIDYIITRTQGPNTLTISPSVTEQETVSQEDINAFMNLDWEEFIYALIVGQFNDTFLDLKPTEKLNLFSSIMSLSFWEQCSKNATTQQAGAVKHLQEAEAKKGTITPRIEALNASKASLEAKRSEFERERHTKLKGLDYEAAAFLDKIGKIELDERVKHSRKNNKIKIVAEVEFDIERIQENLNEIQTQVNSITTDITVDESTVTGLTKDFNKWKDLKDANCPYCEQSVQNVIVTTNKLKISKEIVGLQKIIKTCNSMLEKLNEQLKFNQDKLGEKLRYSAVAIADVAIVDEDLKSLAQAKNSATQELRHTREQLDLIREGKNPFTDLLYTCRQDLEKATRLLVPIEEEITKQNREVLGFQYWIKGFKELRLWVITDALMALEIEVNSTIAKFGLMDWKLNFKLERETTDGDLAKGFHVFVHPKDFKGDEFVSFHTWSGGEKQRLRLSGVKGISSLIQSWKGLNFNVSVWDEPASYLSEEGIDDLLRFLEEEAQENNKAVYLIDHRHLESPYFSSIIRVEKFDEGSKICDDV